MKIIILTKKYENYLSGYYHHDINLAFMKKGECYLYGPDYSDYNKKDTIQDVIAKSPFSKSDLDLIVVNTSWEIQDTNIVESDPHPNINLRELEIPKIFFLNKEYKKLKQKLEYARKNAFDLICTVHHDYGKWMRETKLNFIQLPFGVNTDHFYDYKMPKIYDFGFTGNLHQNYDDIRYKIKTRLFKDPQIVSNIGLNGKPKNNLLNEEFKKYLIYWNQWTASNIFKRIMLNLNNNWTSWEIKSILKGMLSPSIVEYPKFLNSFKIFLSTPGPINIIGTRYFECMAVKTLLFCPENKYYGDIFKDQHNCVLFKENLSDFAEKFHNILNDNLMREKIVETAYQEAITKHTYNKRIEGVLNYLDI